MWFNFIVTVLARVPIASCKYAQHAATWSGGSTAWSKYGSEQSLLFGVDSHRENERDKKGHSVYSVIIKILKESDQGAEGEGKLLVEDEIEGISSRMKVREIVNHMRSKNLDVDDILREHGQDNKVEFFFNTLTKYECLNENYQERSLKVSSRVTLARCRKNLGNINFSANLEKDVIEVWLKCPSLKETVSATTLPARPNSAASTATTLTASSSAWSLPNSPLSPGTDFESSYWSNSNSNTKKLQYDVSLYFDKTFDSLSRIPI
eukprot:gene873-386_t